MLTMTWDRTVFGITLTVISVALNVLLYGATAINLKKALRFLLRKSN